MVTVQYRAGRLLLIKNVEGIACEACGEQLIDRDTAKAPESSLPNAVPLNPGDHVEVGPGPVSPVIATVTSAA